MMKRVAQTRHQHILNDISQKIISRQWDAGFQLPFEVELAEHYGVSRMTVNKVMTQLVAAGMIERRRKKGSFVRLPQSQAAVLSINEISMEIESLNLVYSWEILSDTVRKASDRLEKSRLNIDDDDLLREVSCLHYGNQHPFCLERRLINLVSVPEAEFADFNAIAPGNWLVNQVPWSSAYNQIKARNAHNAAKILKISEHSACLCVERLTRNNIGIVTFVELTYPGERHAVVAEFTPNSV